MPKEELKCDFTLTVEFRSSIALCSKVDVEIDARDDTPSENCDDSDSENESKLYELKQVYNENCFLKSMNLGKLEMLCPPKELYCDELNVQIFFSST